MPACLPAGIQGVVRPRPSLQRLVDDRPRLVHPKTLYSSRQTTRLPSSQAPKLPSYLATKLPHPVLRSCYRLPSRSLSKRIGGNEAGPRSPTSTIPVYLLTSVLYVQHLPVCTPSYPWEVVNPGKAVCMCMYIQRVRVRKGGQGGSLNRCYNTIE